MYMFPFLYKRDKIIITLYFLNIGLIVINHSRNRK